MNIMSQQGPTNPMARLIEQLGRLPGVGNRSAQRMAFHLLKSSAQEAHELAQAILDLKEHSRQCSVCANLSQTDPCPICADPQREQGLILVVEQPADVATIESTGLYKGVYHVLMGRLAPLEGQGPGELNIDSLLQRVNQGSVREVILGLHPNLEGDGTSLYLAQRLQTSGVKVTRLARGLPTGYNLQIASKAVLADALAGRQGLDG